MKKPITLAVNDAKDEIVKILNDAELPAFCIKIILSEILNQVQMIDEEEIKKYNVEKEKEDSKDEL